MRLYIGLFDVEGNFNSYFHVIQVFKREAGIAPTDPDTASVIEQADISEPGLDAKKFDAINESTDVKEKELIKMNPIAES